MTQTKTIRAFAPAKLNLCLHITDQLPSGYHALDSLVVFADVGDVITVSKSDKMTLTITGPYGQGLTSDGENLVSRAAALFGDRCPTAITLVKNLPVSSGIGGGSADAAATLRAMAQLWGQHVPDVAAQLRLGADVPVCMHQTPVRMQGIGGEISTFRDVPELHLVLVNPNVAVSTPQVFSAITQKQNPDLSDVLDTPFLEWLGAQRNDMQVAASQLHPVIGDVIKSLDGALLARMSGSGATCFGVYPTKKAATEAAQIIAQHHPDWWVKPTQTIGSMG